MSSWIRLERIMSGWYVSRHIYAESGDSLSPLKIEITALLGKRTIKLYQSVNRGKTMYQYQPGGVVIQLGVDLFTSCLASGGVRYCINLDFCRTKLQLVLMASTF